MEVKKAEDECKINELPDELLLKIFSYLDSDERNYIKLVCDKWRSFSYDISFANTQKFVFVYSRDNVNDFLRFLENFKCDFLTVEFHCVNLNFMRDYNWMSIGPKLESLRLFECCMDIRPLRFVILYCTKLRDLHIQSLPLSLDRIIEIGNMLRELNAINIVRANLRTYQMYHFSSAIIPTTHYEQVFQLFPCIEQFGCGYAPSGFKIERNMYYNLPPLTLPWIDNYLRNLKTLIMNIPSDFHWLEVLTGIYEIRLTTLEIVFSSNRNIAVDPLSILCKFLKEKKHLRRLRLQIPLTSNDFVNDVLFNDLPLSLKSSKIEELHLDYEADSTIGFATENVIRSFFANIQELKSLTIRNFGKNYWFEYLSLDAVLPHLQGIQLYSLNALQLNSVSSFTESILNCCINLQHVEIENVTNEILQLLFSRHREIKILIVHLNNPYTKYTEFGFTGYDTKKSEKCGYSITELTQLKYLKISIPPLDPIALEYFNKNRDAFLRKFPLGERFFREFYFQNLKFLEIPSSIYVKAPEYLEENWVLEVNSPEYWNTFMRDGYEFLWEALLKFNEVKHLYYVEGSTRITLGQLSEQCPALRVIAREKTVLRFNPLYNTMVIFSQAYDFSLDVANYLMNLY